MMEQQNQDNQLKFNTFLKEVETFSTELPLANPPRAAELLYNKFEEVLLYKATINQKLQLLEILSPVVRKLYDALKYQLLQSIPLVAIQKKDIISWAIQLPMRFATVYASLLSQQNLIPSAEDNGKDLKAYVIFSAMSFLLDTLIVCYDLYMSIPKGLWQRLHALYALAEKLNLNDVAIPHHEKFKSINNIYKICLLLSTSSPYQLRRRDTEQLFKTILKWSDALDISKDISEAKYIVDLRNDSPPLFKSLFPINKKTEFIRGLNSDNFIEAIQHIIRQHSDEVEMYDTALSKNVLDYIVRSWGAKYQRNSERVKKSGPIKICIGLTAAHYYIGGEKHFDKSQSRPDEEILLNNHEYNSENNPHKETLSPFESAQESTDPWNNFFNLSGEDARKKAQYKLYDFQFCDESDGGFRIRSENTNIPMLRNGEIVGIQYPESDYQYQWRVGIIRWFKCETGYIDVGIQTLAPDALTVAVKVTKENSKEICQALLLPELSNHQQPSTILLPANKFVKKMPIKVFHGDNTVYIVLVDAINANNHFYQFTYQTLETAQNRPEVEFNKKIENLKVDNIWDDLLKHGE